MCHHCATPEHLASVPKADGEVCRGLLGEVLALGGDHKILSLCWDHKILSLCCVVVINGAVGARIWDVCRPKWLSASLLQGNRIIDNAFINQLAELRALRAALAAKWSP